MVIKKKIAGADVGSSSGKSAAETKSYKTIGFIERLSPKLDKIIPKDTKIRLRTWDSNCAFNADFFHIATTKDDHLLRVQLN